MTLHFYEKNDSCQTPLSYSSSSFNIESVIKIVVRTTVPRYRPASFHPAPSTVCPDPRYSVVLSAVSVNSLSYSSFGRCHRFLFFIIPMSSQVRYYQVYHLQIQFDESNGILTFLGDQQIYVERNAQGSFPPRQVFVREGESMEGAGTSARSGLEDLPPAEMPRGELLPPEEADLCSQLFDAQRLERGTLKAVF